MMQLHFVGEWSNLEKEPVVASTGWLRLAGFDWLASTGSATGATGATAVEESIKF